MIFKIEEEERRLEAAIEETERQNAEVNSELRELELKSNRFKELEERYILPCTLTILYFQTKQCHRSQCLKILIPTLNLQKKYSIHTDRFSFLFFSGVYGCLMSMIDFTCPNVQQVLA